MTLQSQQRGHLANLGVIAAKAAPTFVVLLAAGTLAAAIFHVSASWNYLGARTVAEPLFEGGQGAPAVFAEAEYRIDAALETWPAHPDYHDFAGRLDILKTRQPGVLGERQRELLDSAEGHFRAALETRPLWPYSWVNLLAVLDKRGRVDKAFNTALEKAIATGPWEPRVQMGVLNAGVRYWDELGARQKEQVDQTLDRALRVQPRKVFELVRFYARPDLVCSRDTNYRQINNWCIQVGAAKAAKAGQRPAEDHRSRGGLTPAFAALAAPTNE